MGFSTLLSFPCGSEVKNLPAKKERQVQTLGRKDLGEGNGNPLQYSCLENPMDRGTWWAIVHGVTKSQTQLSDWTTTNKLLFTYCLICPRFVLWELLQPGSWVVWPCFHHILSTFLLCGTTRYSWSFLYFAWVSSKFGHFSQKPWFLSLDNRTLMPGYNARCDLISSSPQWAKFRNTCMNTSTCRYI